MSTLKSINVIHPSSAVNNIVNDASGNVALGNNLTVAGTVSSAGTVVMGSSFKRNRIINGNMGVWQRGTSGFTTINNYCADRWYATAGTSLSAVAQSSDVPTGYKYSLSISGTNLTQAAQRIESVNCTDLAGQSVTISFWAKQTSGAGSNSLLLQLSYPTSGADTYSGGTTQIGSNVLFTGTTSWVQYTTTFTSISANAANGLQLNIYANTASSATILITGVQLEVGTVATPYEMQIYSDQLAQCQRYYWTMGGKTVAFTTATATGYGFTVTFPAWFPVYMRAVPTVSVNLSASTNITASGSINIDASGFSFFVNSNGATSPNITSGTFNAATASAEL